MSPSNRTPRQIAAADQRLATIKAVVDELVDHAPADVEDPVMALRERGIRVFEAAQDLNTRAENGDHLSAVAAIGAELLRRVLASSTLSDQQN